MARSLKGILIRFALMEVLGFLGVVGILSFLIWGLMGSHLIGSAQELTQQADQLTKKIQQKNFSPQQIPPYFAYEITDKKGKIVASTFTSRDQKAVVHAKNTGRYQTANSAFNMQEYRYIVGAKYNVSLRFLISGYFRNPTLYKFFPRIDLLVVASFVLLLSVSSLLILRHFAKRLQQELHKAAELNEHLLAQDLTYEPVASSITEIQQLINGMDRLKHELAASLKSQWQKEQQLTENIQAITHDIKTPISIMQGNVELLAEDEPEQAELQVILRNLARLNDYVDELKVISALAPAKTSTKSISIELVEHWGQIGAVLAKAHQLNFKLGPLEASQKKINPADLTRALENIFNNAVEHTAATGEIRFSAYHAAGYYWLMIQNSGGFSEAALRHGKERFFTEKTARTNEHYGLGLTIAAQLVSQSGGTLFLSNTDTEAQVKLRF